NARFITPEEVAEFIWFLAQPHAAAITGANLSIDFGLSSGIFPHN
ncbi:MAG: SDR family oxidoreductase, partial [Actinomycetota bacterium]